MAWYDGIEKAGEAFVAGAENAFHGGPGIISGSVTGGVLGAVAGIGLDTGQQQPATPALPDPANAKSFAQQVQQQTQIAQNLKAAANDPGFTLEPEATQAVIKTLQNALDKWKNSYYNAVIVATNYKLGSTPGAKVISEWNQKIGEQFVTAYRALGPVYQDQIDALTKAMQNYQDAEDKNADSLRKAGED